jgi:hypothetical protein
MIAVSCGTPTPATSDVAGDDLHGVGKLLDAIDGFQHA